MNEGQLESLRQHGVDRYLYISTVHITPYDGALLTRYGLEGDNEDIGVTNSVEGHWVFVSDDIRENPERVEKLLDLGFSDAFCNILKGAHQLSCMYVHFDGAGPVFDRIPEFDALWGEAEAGGNLNVPPTIWLKELFEFEFCSECGGDAQHHTAVPVMGNWFARCDYPNEDYPDEDFHPVITKFRRELNERND
jgi:hypothetical protein